MTTHERLVLIIETFRYFCRERCGRTEGNCPQVKGHPVEPERLGRSKTQIFVKMPAPKIKLDPRNMAIKDCETEPVDSMNYYDALGSESVRS